MQILVCNLLIVITSLYRLLRTPSGIVEISKPPVNPDPHQGNSPGLESGSGAPTGNDGVSDTGRRESATREGNVSENSGPPTKTSSSTSALQLTELYDSDFSIPEFQSST
jgi:hypothetical protein